MPHVSHGFKFNWFNFHHLFNGIKVQIKVLTHIFDEVVWSINFMKFIRVMYKCTILLKTNLQTWCLRHLNCFFYLYSLFRFGRLLKPKQDYGGDRRFSWFLALGNLECIATVLAALKYSPGMFDTSPAIIPCKHTLSIQRPTSFLEE